MMTKRFSGTAPEADEYRLFTLRNASDMVATITERDAALWSWRAPDRYGRMADVLLAPKGAANPVLWQGRHADGGVTLLRTGGGGAVAQLAKYRLDDDGCLSVEHEVVAMAPTPLDLAAWPTFNLNGGIADVGDHMVQIDADYYVEVDADGMPSGVAAVAGTAFDFRQPAPIGARLRWPDSQICGRGGFNHSLFVRSHFAGGQGRCAPWPASSIRDRGAACRSRPPRLPCSSAPATRAVSASRRKPVPSLPARPGRT